MPEKKEWVVDVKEGHIFGGLETSEDRYNITNENEWWKPLDDIVAAYNEGGLEAGLAEACRVIYHLTYAVMELKQTVAGLERRYERHTHREEFVVKD